MTCRILAVLDASRALVRALFNDARMILAKREMIEITTRSSHRYKWFDCLYESENIKEEEKRKEKNYHCNPQ